MQIAQLALLPGFSFVSTLTEEDSNTHEHVPQFSLVTPLNDVFAMTLATIRAEVAAHGDSTKIVRLLDSQFLSHFESHLEKEPG